LLGLGLLRIPARTPAAASTATPLSEIGPIAPVPDGCLAVLLALRVAFDF
jgi:hypothetical protein